MLNELRSQRDMALQLNEHWLIEQDDHRKRANQLEAAFEQNDELEAKNNQLHTELLNFKTTQRQVDRARPRQATQPAEPETEEVLPPHTTPEIEQRPRTSRESSTISGNGTSRFKTVKMPDSPIFIETSDPI